MTDYNSLNGLSSTEAEELLVRYGKNTLSEGKKESVFAKILHIASEPMFILLIAAAVIYFLLGQPRDGAIMLVFVLGVIFIDIVQQLKTDKTLEALKELTAPQACVIRDGKELTVPSELIVPGDILFICEGVKIPADGNVMILNDLCVDESTFTGEAAAVWKKKYPVEGKSDYFSCDMVYAGSTVTQGSGYIKVTATGRHTEYGKIGETVASAKEEKTPLNIQTDDLVKKCAFLAFGLFLLVGLFTFLSLSVVDLRERIVSAILSGITLAMAMIPEEFPVILTVFLSMGAWRLAKKNALVRKLPSVETLGAVNVLCVDKTGTITENRMQVESILANETSDDEKLLTVMSLACEKDCYDQMEKAMLSYAAEHGIPTDQLFNSLFLGEYAFTNEKKMMGHIWENAGSVTIAAKGSAEKILPLCTLTEKQIEKALDDAAHMAMRGLRVIAVGVMQPESRGDIPHNIEDCRFEYCGLIGLSDPPRANIKDDIATCTSAGIRVVMITGDNGVTASAIAKAVGIPHCNMIITGSDLEEMSDEDLREKVRECNIFSRVIPEHKMRIVKAFRDNGDIVAMTGDGVNDAAALKYADIGISMGKRGSEVSREAADLILTDDNFSTIVTTVHDGRRIYDNIKKAVGYVFAIHIPIALSSLVAPLLGISPGDVFLLPLHVVLLELIIDPTCSIVLERQPSESDVMQIPPRAQKESILDRKVVLPSLVSGTLIFISSFGLYLYCLKNGSGAAYARSAGLCVIILSNILLVQVNASLRDSLFVSVRQLAKDNIMWLANIAIVAALLILLYTPLARIFSLAPLSARTLAAAAVLAILSVGWYEIVKSIRRKKH